MIRVLRVGPGSIGCANVAQMSERGSFEIAGGVDCDPQKIGRDIAIPCTGSPLSGVLL